MDGERFDAFAREITARRGRRNALRVLAGAGLASLGARAVDAKRRRTRCRHGATRCGRGCCAAGDKCTNIDRTCLCSPPAAPTAAGRITPQSVRQCVDALQLIGYLVSLVNETWPAAPPDVHPTDTPADLGLTRDLWGLVVLNVYYRIAPAQLPSLNPDDYPTAGDLASALNRAVFGVG